MTNNICKICNQPFTRRWNLERHIQDVHQKNPYSEKAKERREINNFNGLSEGIDKKNFFRNEKDKIMDINYNHNYYPSFPSTFTYPGYYHDELYSYQNFNSQSKQEKRLSLDDKIKILKNLKNLENYLRQLFPELFIYKVKTWLRYKCMSEKSYEPLKKYMVQNNMGHLWSEE